MGALLQAMGTGGGEGQEDPNDIGMGQQGMQQPGMEQQQQRPFITPYAQRNPQDQMMSMAGLLLASGIPLGKAIPQASQMMQQQAQSQQQQFHMQMQQMQMAMQMHKYQQMMNAEQADNDLINQLTGNTMGGGGGGGGRDMTTMNSQIGNAIDESSGGGMTLAQSLGDSSAPSAPAGNIEMGGANALPKRTNPQSGRKHFKDLDPDTQGIITATLRADRKEGLKMLQEALNPKPTEPAPLEKELAKKDAETISTAETDVKDLMGLKSALNSFKVNMKNTPDALMGRGIGSISPYISSNAQAAEADANTIALIGKKLLAMPSNNFSDADRNFLVNATVGLNKSKEANTKTMARLEDLINKQVDYTKSLTARLADKGNLRGVATDSYEKNYGNNNQPSQSQNPGQQSNQQNAPKRSIGQLSNEELMAIVNGR